MAPRFYRAADLVGTTRSRRVGERGILVFSPAVLWRKVRDGTFPPAIKISTNITAWPTDEVDSIAAAYKAGKSDADLRALVKRIVAARTESRPEALIRG